MPLLFGVLSDHQAIPLQVGYQDQLAADVPYFPGGGAGYYTIYLSSETVAQQIPSSGIIQIDQERMFYALSNLSAPPYVLLTNVRGYQGTQPAEHSRGATVYFIERTHIYGFGHAPEGYHYGDNSCRTLRINGIVKSPAEPPIHTIRPQDGRIFPDEIVFTVEFNMDSIIPEEFQVQTGSTVLAGGSTDDVTLPMDPASRALRRKHRRLARQGKLPEQRFATVGMWGAGRTITGVMGRAGGSGVMHLLTRSPNPVPAPIRPPVVRPPISPTAGISKAATPTTTTTTYRRFQAPQLGTVSADVFGLLDSTGEITGTVDARIERPAHVTRVVLEEGYLERNDSLYHQPTWDATHAIQVQYGLTWALAFAGSSLSDFRQLAGLCGIADLFLDEKAQWRYRFRDPQALATATITEREIFGDVGLDFTQASSFLNTVLPINWGSGLTAGAFVLESEAMQARYGFLRSRTLDLPFLVEEKLARLVGSYWLHQWDHPRLLGSVGVTHAMLAVGLADRVFIDNSIMTLYGQRRIPFDVRGFSDRGDHRVFALAEGDPLAVRLPLYVSLKRAPTISLPLFVTVGQADAIILSDTLQAEVIASSEEGMSVDDELLAAIQDHADAGEFMLPGGLMGG